MFFFHNDAKHYFTLYIFLSRIPRLPVSQDIEAFIYLVSDTVIHAHLCYMLLSDSFNLSVFQAYIDSAKLFQYSTLLQRIWHVIREALLHLSRVDPFRGHSGAWYDGMSPLYYVILVWYDGTSQWCYGIVAWFDGMSPWCYGMPRIVWKQDDLVLWYAAWCEGTSAQCSELHHMMYIGIVLWHADLEWWHNCIVLWYAGEMR